MSGGLALILAAQILGQTTRCAPPFDRPVDCPEKYITRASGHPAQGPGLGPVEPRTRRGLVVEARAFGSLERPFRVVV